MTFRTAAVLGGDPSCFSDSLENNRGDHGHDASMLEFLFVHFVRLVVHYSSVHYIDSVGVIAILASTPFTLGCFRMFGTAV